MEYARLFSWLKLINVRVNFMVQVFVVEGARSCYANADKLLSHFKNNFHVVSFAFG